MKHEPAGRLHHAEPPQPTHEHHPAHTPTVKATARHDHAAIMADPSHARAMEADMRRRFLVALGFTLPVIVLAGHLPGLPMLVEPRSRSPSWLRRRSGAFSPGIQR